MKHFYLILILLCFSAITLPAQAAMGDMQGKATMGNAKNTGAGQTAKTQIFLGQGKINSINPDANMVNVAMGPVKALGWPSMSMNFVVQDKTLLNGLKTGEIVSFDFAKNTDGGYVITRITPAAP
ncbi:copper-binding protein [Acidithiobacillus ferrooxidans]|uniref:copper-binding protein n=1 Tax=Acidithiobacillus ferrooxidans TaxID=920 RepID=UPI001C06EE7B|nr:copper-binding protein [Acidithiobacillus ferrooxidans]MBU2774449.1 copper-binding protein [Acidithiobacillus ferrooxidans]